MIYMSSRLVVNLTQVYSPLYILDSLGMSRVCSTAVLCMGVVVFLGCVPIAMSWRGLCIGLAVFHSYCPVCVVLIT